METYGTNGHKVLIVNNQTNDLVSKKYLDTVRAYMGPLDIEVVDNNGSYETSAAIYAIRNFPEEEKFLMIHDTCTPTSDQWVTQFEEKLTPEVGAVSWVKFRPCLFYVSPDHFKYMDLICSHDDVPDGGIFGGIFMAYGSILRDFDKKGYFQHPTTQKHHAEAWERIWAILFHINGYNIECINDGFNPNTIHYGGHPHLKKTFGGRG